MGLFDGELLGTHPHEPDHPLTQAVAAALRGRFTKALVLQVGPVTEAYGVWTGELEISKPGSKEKGVLRVGGVPISGRGSAEPYGTFTIPRPLFLRMSGVALDAADKWAKDQGQADREQVVFDKYEHKKSTAARWGRPAPEKPPELLAIESQAESFEAPVAEIEARLVVTYSPEGGVVLEGTERGDAPGIKRVDAARFRWSSRQGFWYVPRSRGGRHRTQGEMERVRAQLEERIGQPVRLDYQRSERTAEEVLATREETGERAQEGRERRADRATREADAAAVAERAAHAALPPWGEPVKVDHYSAPRHRRDLERAHTTMGKRIETAQRAERAERIAARGASDGATLDAGLARRRIDRRDAEIRRQKRYLAELVGEDLGAHRRDTQEIIDSLELENEADRLAMERQGDKLWSPADFNVGDRVKYDEFVTTVQRVNPKSVTFKPDPAHVRSDFIALNIWKVPYSYMGDRARIEFIEKAPPKAPKKKKAKKKKAKKARGYLTLEEVTRAIGQAVAAYPDLKVTRTDFTDTDSEWSIEAPGGQALDAAYYGHQNNLFYAQQAYEETRGEEWSIKVKTEADLVAAVQRVIEASKAWLGMVEPKGVDPTRALVTFHPGSMDARTELLHRLAKLPGKVTVYRLNGNLTVEVDVAQVETVEAWPGLTKIQIGKAWVGSAGGDTVAGQLADVTGDRNSGPFPFPFTREDWGKRTTPEFLASLPARADLAPDQLGDYDRAHRSELKHGVDRVFLVSCGSKKLDAPADARELYIGQGFTDQLRWAEFRQDLDKSKEVIAVGVLSAKYGLVLASAELEPYNLRLDELTKEARAQWARSVAATLIGWTHPGSVIVTTAPADYRRDWPAMLREQGREVIEPLDGLDQFQRRSALTQARKRKLTAEQLEELGEEIKAAKRSQQYSAIDEDSPLDSLAAARWVAGPVPGQWRTFEDWEVWTKEVSDEGRGLPKNRHAEHRAMLKVADRIEIDFPELGEARVPIRTVRAGAEPVVSTKPPRLNMLRRDYAELLHAETGLPVFTNVGRPLWPLPERKKRRPTFKVSQDRGMGYGQQGYADRLRSINSAREIATDIARIYGEPAHIEKERGGGYVESVLPPDVAQLSDPEIDKLRAEVQKVADSLAEREGEEFADMRRGVVAWLAKIDAARPSVAQVVAPDPEFDKPIAAAVKPGPIVLKKTDSGERMATTPHGIYNVRKVKEGGSKGQWRVSQADAEGTAGEWIQDFGSQADARAWLADPDAWLASQLAEIKEEPAKKKAKKKPAKKPAKKKAKKKAPPRVKELQARGRAREKFVDPITGETVPSGTPGAVATGDYIARARSAKGKPLRTIAIAESELGEPTYKIDLTQAELNQRAKARSETIEESQAMEKSLAELKGKQALPGVRGTFRTAGQAAREFLAANSFYYMPLTEGGDVGDAIREWGDSQEVWVPFKGRKKIGVSEREAGEYRRLGATTKGAKILDSSLGDEAQILKALTWVFSQARSKRYSDVEWGRIDSLNSKLEWALEMNSPEASQFRGAQATVIYPAASGHYEGKELLAHPEVQQSPRALAKVRAEFNESSLFDLTRELEAAYETARACLPPAVRRTVLRRLRYLKELLDHPTRISDDSICAHARATVSNEILAAMEEGGVDFDEYDATCVYPLVVEDTERLIKTCTEGYDLDWPTKEAQRWEQSPEKFETQLEAVPPAVLHRAATQVQMFPTIPAPEPAPVYDSPAETYAEIAEEEERKAETLRLLGLAAGRPVADSAPLTFDQAEANFDQAEAGMFGSVDEEEIPF